MARERRIPASADSFDEHGYLAANPDVARAVEEGQFASGFHHFSVFGYDEGREMLVADGVRAAARRLLAPAASAAEAVVDRGRRRLDPHAAQDAERIDDLEVRVQQLEDLLQFVHGLAPPPPKHLQVRVVGNYGADFVSSGSTSVLRQLKRALAVVDHDVADFDAILDFGCGCGRSIFTLSQVVPDADLHGTDIDAEAIEWLSEHHPGLATYQVAPTAPPMPYEPDRFDFVFGISVFTHLPEDLQFAWLDELARITKPGGYLVMTTHGRRHHHLLDEASRATIADTGFLYRATGYGASVSLPDFYESAYHTHDYIRSTWSRYFDIVDIMEPEPGEHQDLVVLRVPS